MKLKWVLVIGVILVVVVVIIVFFPKNKLNINKNQSKPDYSEPPFIGIEHTEGSKINSRKQKQRKGKISNQESKGMHFSPQPTSINENPVGRGSDINRVLKTVEEVNRINQLNKRR